MRHKGNIHKAVSVTMIGVLLMSSLTPIKANVMHHVHTDETNEGVAQHAGYTFLSGVKTVEQFDNVVTISYLNGEKSKITFLESGLFRFDMEPDGKEESFKDYAQPNNKKETGRIIQQKDDSSEYRKPTPTLNAQGTTLVIATNDIHLEIHKQTSKMKLSDATGKVVWEEKAPLQYKKGSTIQTLVEHKNENFYGGGTQNGRFAHKGTSIEIKNTNNWVDGGVASPNPFYWSTNGYGIIRNTFQPGVYDFGKTKKGAVTTTHNENRFDAYFFVGKKPSAILDQYYKVTGNPMLFPENSFYLGHLNCYNRDEWTPATSGGNVLEDGNRYKETNNAGQILNGGVLETLNGTNPTSPDYTFSAQAVVNGHVDKDMPFGWFLPNDGYGCGYGQSKESMDANINNLKKFSDYAKARGVNTGLWTQSALTPDPNEPIHLQRDFEKEVMQGGVRTLKTDVAWVGSGYSFALDGIRNAYDIIAKTKERPTIVSLDGWAGTQRYAGIWTGDQTGGNWEYIRFHIPTYIGQSLSGNPNVSSDVDGIFGGNSLIQTRDIQWKSFTTMMLDMDGWGAYPKKPYIFGEDTTSINRMYLKLRAELLPYVYSTAYTSSNLGSNDERGKPQVRAMFIEYPEDPNTYGTNVQYQYMFGKNLLVAPVYKNTNAKENGDDIRNGIYLPDEDQTWIDYFTGKQYQGGKVQNNFDAPIWKLPLFVKNGAILPMYAEHNNPAPITETNTKGLDKTKRRIEFYPDATKPAGTYFTSYEDDGTSIDNSNANEPTYGSTVTTKYTSIVKEDTAVLTAEKSSGTYAGYDANRVTTFIVNVSQEPTRISAKNGSQLLQKSDFNIVTTQAEFDQASGNVYFYNEEPNLNKYATQGSEFQKKNITTTPKLYVKFAKTNVDENTIALTVHGFVNDGKLDKNEVNSHLRAPSDLKAVAEGITPTSIPLTWNKVEGATSYELETDGIVQSGITGTKFQHIDLEYHSTHTYRVRAVNANGYSPWSERMEAQSALDPYRNVPKDITLKWDHGDSWGALKNALDFDYGTMFHSSNSDALGKDFIMDMKKVYVMDKFEYTPRQDNKGNGTVQQMDMYTSVDGKNYTLVHEGVKNEWTYTDDASRDTKTISLLGIKARYLKFVVRKSKGGFFSAAEMQPYRKDGTTGIVPGDTNNDGVVDEEDLKQIGYYVGLEKGDAAWDQVETSDWNANGYFDAQDISYTTTLVNGGIKKGAGDPEGSVQFIADKTFVKKGEKVTVNVFGINMKNVYSAGFKVPYDKDNMSFETAKAGLATVNMQQFVYDRVSVKTSENLANYTRNTNLVFSNIGDQRLVNGTHALGTLTFSANQDMELNHETFKDTEAIFVSSNLASVDAKAAPTRPPLPAVEYKLTADNISVKGENEHVLQPGMGVDKLIDGNIGSDAYRFEFKWGNSEADVPARLPYDITFTFDKPRMISKLKIYIRQDGNTVNAAALKDFDLIGVKTDGTQEQIVTASLTKAETSFMEHNKTVYAGIIVKAKTSQAGQIFKLNIDEVEFYESTETKVTGIELDHDNPSEIYVGRIANFSANVLPNDASNPYYDVTSTDPNVVEIITTATANGYAYALKGNTAGRATLTVTSKGTKEDGTKARVETDIQVISDIYTKDLAYLIQTALEKIKHEQLFTQKSLKDVKNAIEKAQKVIADTASQNDIDNQLIELYKVLVALEYKGSIEDQLDSTDEITNQNLSFVSASSQAAESPATNAIDGDESTFWHSNYHSGFALPQDILVDLGGNYNLQQVNYLPRQDGSHNGDITRYRVEVSKDGTTFIPVIEGTLDHNGSSLLNRDNDKKIKFEQTPARYVKFIALHSLGDKKDTYASAAEFKFFGKHIGENIPATSIHVDKTEISDMQPGDVVRIQATITPVNATDSLTWTSDNENVATVNTRGEITAVAQGDATMTVSANEQVNATIKVQVRGSNRDTLQALIEEAKAKRYDNVEIQKALQEAIVHAELALDGSVEDMNDAYLMLVKTMKELDSLNNHITAIVGYSMIDLSIFEAGEHANNYKVLVEKALEFVKEPFTFRNEISDIRSAIAVVYKKLIKLKLDELREMVDYVKHIQLEEYVNNEEKTIFIALIQEAENLKPTANEQIKVMIDKLIEGLNALERKASSAQIGTIKKLVSELRARPFANYTKEDQFQMKKGIEIAYAALANNNLGYKEAEDVIVKLNVLLRIKPEIIDSNKGDNNGNTVIVNPSNPVHTGDDANVVVWFSYLGLGGLGVWIASRARKKSKKS